MAPSLALPPLILSLDPIRNPLVAGVRRREGKHDVHGEEEDKRQGRRTLCCARSVVGSAPAPCWTTPPRTTPAGSARPSYPADGRVPTFSTQDLERVAFPFSHFPYAHPPFLLNVA
jgi:hypothetical protein